MIAVDWKKLVANRYLLSLLPGETQIAGVIATELMFSLLGVLLINHLLASK